MIEKPIPAVMYHHVNPVESAFSVSPVAFETQMRWLSENGYVTLKADQLLNYLLGKCEIPSKSIVITFDDGYLDNYIYAYPILKKFGLSAILFVVTGWVSEGEARSELLTNKEMWGNPDHKVCMEAIQSGKFDEVMLRWSEISEMEAAEVFEVHSHSHSHIRWDKEYSEPRLVLEAVKTDLQLSRDIIKNKTGKQSQHFCWPWGFYNPSYTKLAKEMGFEAIHTTSIGFNTIRTGSYLISRFGIESNNQLKFISLVKFYENRIFALIFQPLFNLIKYAKKINK